MLRFLRRYNKGILVVGGVLLLVAWSISGSLDRIAKATAGRGATWATVDGTAVRAGDLQKLQAELQLIDVIGSGVLPVPDVSKDPLYYYLLQKEASENGLIGTQVDGLRWLETTLAAGNAQITPDQWIGVLQARTGQSRQAILETLAKISGMRRLVNMAENAPRLSDRRLQGAASLMLASVDADVVVIDARRLAATSSVQPTDAQLQKQLDEYGAKTAGVDGAIFGYKLPNRLKLEWLIVPAASIRTAVEASDRLNNIELRKYRDRNIAMFPKPADGSDNFDDVRDTVRTALLNDLVAEKTGDVAKFAADQMALPLRGLPREGVYFTLPADWDAKRPALDQLGATIRQQFNLTDLPIYQSSGPDWIEPGAVDRQPGIGTATSDRFGQTPVKASALVAQAKEFGGADTYAIQEGVVGPPLRTPVGDVVLFRIVDTDPARAPRTIDEVRDKLVADVKAMAEFERLKASLDALKQKAAEQGLVELAAANNASVQAAIDLRQVDPRFLGSPFRFAPSIPGLGSSEAAVKALVQFATALPGAMGGPSAKPVAQLAESDRIFAFPAEQQLSVVVGRVTDVSPLTIEDFEIVANTGAIERAVLMEETADLRTALFSRDALMKRHDVVLARAAEDAEKAKQDAAAAEAATSKAATG